MSKLYIQYNYREACKTEFIGKVEVALLIRNPEYVPDTVDAGGKGTTPKQMICRVDFLLGVRLRALRLSSKDGGLLKELY